MDGCSRALIQSKPMRDAACTVPDGGLILELAYISERTPPMAKKLVIVMANTDPRNGEELGAPIFQASVAAAMEYDVEVICTATAGRLMKKGVAEKLFVKPGSPKSVYDFIKDAHEAGARFYCCSPNLDLFDMTKDDLIPECEGIVGGAHLIEQVMEEDCKVMTY